MIQKKYPYLNTKWLLITFVMMTSWLLTACAGESSAVPIATDELAGNTAVLNFYNWDTYIDPQISEDFEEKYGVTINYTIFESDDDVLDEMRAGPIDQDIVVPSDINVTSMRQEDLLYPLDKNNIPNLGNLAAEFQNPAYDPGNRYCAAYQWGTFGIGYSTDRVDQEITSLDDLFNPDFAGRIALMDDVRTVLGAMLIYLGYSPNTTDRRQILEARDLLMSHAEQFIMYAPDTGQDMLLAGEADIVLEWSGDILQATADDSAIQYIIPQEGSIIWTDNMCIPASASNKTLAETFINYILEPEVGATLSNFIRYGTPNESSIPFINAEDIANPAIYPPDDVRQRLFFLVSIGSEVEDFYQQTWAEILTHHQSIKTQ